MEANEDQELVAAIVALGNVIGVGSDAHITMGAVWADVQACDLAEAKERLASTFNEVRGMCADPSVFGPIRDFIIARDVLAKLKAGAQ